MVKALVVDDEEDICEFLKDQIAEMGFEVTTAFTGEHGFEALDKSSFDLVVVDLRLSTTFTGLDVIKAAQKKNPHAAVIAMSGYVDISLRQETGKLGVAGYFMKPDDLQMETFRKKVTEILKEKGIKI